MTTVVANPVHNAGGQRPSLVGQAIPKIQENAAAASRWVRANPWQSTAVLLSGISTAFNCIALFTPWYTYSFTAAGIDTSGRFQLLDARVCVDTSDGRTQSQYAPVKSCLSWENVNGPPALDWLYSAGAAAFAMMIIALAFNVMAFWLTYLRRIGALGSLSRVLQPLRGFIVSALCRAPLLFTLGHNMASHFSMPMASPSVVCLCLQWTVIFHACAALFLMIAFSVWAGRINANSDTWNTYLATVTAAGGSKMYGGGFAITIVAWMLSAACAGIIFVFREETAPAPSAAAATPGASATAPGPAAFTGAIDSGAGAYGGVDHTTGVPPARGMSAIGLSAEHDAAAFGGGGSYHPGAPGADERHADASLADVKI